MTKKLVTIWLNAEGKTYAEVASRIPHLITREDVPQIVAELQAWAATDDSDWPLERVKDQ